MAEDYELKEPSQEEATQLTAEITAILEKYNCEIAVRSNIEILKRVPITKDGENRQDNQEEATEVHQADSSPQA